MPHCADHTAVGTLLNFVLDQTINPAISIDCDRLVQEFLDFVRSILPVEEIYSDELDERLRSQGVDQEEIQRLSNEWDDLSGPIFNYLQDLPFAGTRFANEMENWLERKGLDNQLMELYYDNLAQLVEEARAL